MMNTSYSLMTVLLKSSYGKRQPIICPSTGQNNGGQLVQHFHKPEKSIGWPEPLGQNLHNEHA